jgi:hypothetical protein
VDLLHVPGRSGTPEELEHLVAEHNLHDALVGAALVADVSGKSHPVGEYVRGLTQLEAAERGSVRLDVRKGDRR